MSRTIKRGAPPKRPAPRRKVPVKKVSVMDRLIGMLPVSEETLKKLVTFSILGTGGAIVIGAAVLAGVPGMIGSAFGESAGRAGFRVTGVEIAGQHRMDSNTIRAVALDQPSLAMPLVDIAAIREKLLQYPWIKDVQVSRRLPDTLLVNVVERTPAAIWQDNGQLRLIDETGVQLDPVSKDAMPDLPLVIGPGADRQEASYQALLAAAPALKPRVKAATWVGNRRWDLTFESGETLALPEDGAPRALVKFAELDGSRPLLGRGWIRFDMRDPTKLVARKPGASLAHSVDVPAVQSDETSKSETAGAGGTGGEV